MMAGAAMLLSSPPLFHLPPRCASPLTKFFIKTLTPQSSMPTAPHLSSISPSCLHSNWSSHQGTWEDPDDGYGSEFEDDMDDDQEEEEEDRVDSTTTTASEFAELAKGLHFKCLMKCPSSESYELCNHIGFGF